MSRLVWLSTASALFFLLFSAAGIAQINGTTPAPAYQSAPLPSDLSGSSYSSRPLPKPGKIVAPFALNKTFSPGSHPIEYLSEDRMSAQDHDLAASEELAVRSAATLAGMELDKGVWTRQQIICQALPDHLLLLYKGNNGPGDISLFSASISRIGNHYVRVIPIQRRSYALFSPVPVNPLVIAAFNRIRASEPAVGHADWLATGLCYAALTGVRPETSEERTKTAGNQLDLSFPPTLEVDARGGATVRFVDVAENPQPMQWALSFNAQGELLHVAHFATPSFAVTTTPPPPDQHPAPHDSH